VGPRSKNPNFSQELPRSKPKNNHDSLGQVVATPGALAAPEEQDRARHFAITAQVLPRNWKKLRGRAWQRAGN
jgi:hypothetical protein